MWIDNMKVDFNIIVEGNLTPENVINKPIALERNPIGVITQAEFDDSKVLINCKGIIWNRFIIPEISSTIDLSNNLTTYELSSIKIG